MSWYRPAKGSTSNQSIIAEESASHMPTSPTQALPPSIGSPRSQQQTIIPMRFGPAVSVLGSPEPEKARSSSSRRTSKPLPTRATTPKAGETMVTSPREPSSNINSNLTPGEPSTSNRRATDPPSPDPTFSTLPAEEYFNNSANIVNASADTGSEMPQYLPSPQTELSLLPEGEHEGSKLIPGAFFSTSTPPLPPQTPDRQGIQQPRTPSPPLRTHSVLQDARSTGAPEPTTIETIGDADSIATVRSVDSTPRIYATGTLHDDFSRISVNGSVEEAFADTVQDSFLFEGAVLSSDSVYARQRRSLLDILNRLHSTGVQKDIDLPQIVVIGSQSVGKSSLIESMSGVTLPRDPGTCTRCPLECRLEYSTDSWSCRVFLRFERDASGNPLENVVEQDFGPLLTDKASVEAVLRRAQRAILRPSLDPKFFLRDKDLSIKEPPSLSFSSNCVCMRIRGPEVPDLYFYDLPGVIANVRDGGDIKDIELVRNLVQEYISRPSCLILLVVSCETDLENQGAGRLALGIDPEGQRTVGVLTKPDRIESATGEKWAAVLRNEENRLLNGWFCVKQPDPTELKQKILWEDARMREDLFFAHQEPWTSMPDHYKRRLGSTNLIRYLSRLLSRLIAVRLPDVERELSLSLEDVTRRLNQLPASKFDDPSNELVTLIFEFTSIVSRNVRGVTQFEESVPSLMQGVRMAQLYLRSAIMRTAPRFCPWARQDTPPGSPGSIRSTATQGTGAPQAWIEEPMFLSSEERIPFDDRTGKIMYLDEVMERAEQSITRELPGDYPTFAVKEELIRMSLKAWGKPMLNYFEAVHALMNQHMKILVDTHFGKYTHSGLHARVMAIVREQLRVLHDTTLQRLNSLLSVEGLPFTLNHMYLKEYKDKFYAHYRDIRRRSKGQDAIVRRFQESEGVVIAQRRTDLVDLTDMLQRFGLTCTPKDLHRLLPEDDLEPALDIIATVRAYFQVAFKRFIDLVPLEIDSGFVRGFDRAIRNALIVGLDVKSSESCGMWLQHSPEVVGRRKELVATKQRLEAARAELSSFVLT